MSGDFFATLMPFAFTSTGSFGSTSFTALLTFTSAMFSFAPGLKVTVSV